MVIKFSFKHDEDCGMPHCWVRHLVTTGEAIEAWYKGGIQEEVLKNGKLKRRAIIANGKDLVVIWFWQNPKKLVRIITAYEYGTGAYYEG